jgi:hypothetical protein
MKRLFLLTRITRQGLLWMAMALLTLGTIAACATTAGDAAQGGQVQSQEQATEQIAALHGGNSCDAPARQGCNSCQISCPSDRIAYCAPGNGYQVLITGGIYEYRCTVGPTCTCTKP